MRRPAKLATLLVTSGLALPLAIPLGAQTSTAARNAAPAVPTMRAARLTGAIRLDGVLDEQAWAAAPVASGFTESYPDPGKPSPERTEVRILYDDDALYAGVRMYDPHPDSIAAQLARRDASGIYSDWLHLIIDSYHDRRTAFRFSVNPMGVKKDVFTSNDGNEDANWDAVWEVATRVDSLGWVAEYRIPFSQLRFGSAPAGAERVWGIQVMRDIARRNQRDSWAPWTPQSPGFVSLFGDLTGLVNIPMPTRLELLPYASTKVTRQPGDPNDPFFHATDARPSVGADVRYGLPGGLTLTGTVNPDFGQVEVDPAVVNLSAFETFFPEKRPFFLEGSDIFSFGQVLRHNDYGSQYFFYSRRIGRQPQLGVRGDSVLYVDAPEQTTIAGAAKVTGKSGPWTVGLLDAVTTEQRARVMSESGTRFQAPVEPLTNYLAGRVRRDFRKGQTVIGAMGTSTTRDMGDPAFRSALRSRASFGGVDFEHDMFNKQWVVSGFLAGSRVAGTRSAITATQRSSSRYFQQPDAAYLHYDTTRTALAGHMGEVAIQRNGAIFASLAYKESSPGFEVNDLGFQSRTDYRVISPFIGWQDYTKGKHLRSFSHYVYDNHAWDFGGRPIFQGYGVGSNATFNNLWSVSAGGSWSPDYYDNRLTRGGPLAVAPSSWSFNVNVSSDSRKPVIVSPFLYITRDRVGGQQTETSVGFDMRPTSFIHVTLGPDLSTLHNTAQWVGSVADPAATATYGRRYLFGELRQTTLSMDTRVEWTFTPTLSLQTYLQPFVSAGRYSDFKALAAPRTFEFTDATVDPQTASSLDFNIRSLRGNAVLRWEYRPGSALFFVWQQERSDYEPFGDFDAGRDVGAIFRTVPTNVFLVKATYWIGR